ncbi:hypothetical protein MBRA1_001775 [Malassezia brasiliensis]|uniref:GATA-type domain-containing protein n=1 Tax=Malassezia brasiliensis TaxID=1821822 RepID=A0AAF0IPN4_9BASI|nr:hypothetical protein MBRA1_001775 [Malassezia brasiliensis]
MAHTAPEDTAARDQDALTAPAPVVSDDRATAPAEKSGLDPAARASFRSSQATPAAAPSQGSYRSPSPPPPAPAALASLSAQSAPYESHGEPRPTRAGEAAPHANYTASRTGTAPAMPPVAAAQPAITPWSSGMQGTLEPNTLYSFERIHAASLALYNYASEHLERQLPAAPEELYGLLPIASEISQELRSLLGMHEGRMARDAADVAPYYPWTSGSAAPPYWMPGSRDERDGKALRGDEGDTDDKAGHLRRRSPSQAKMNDRMAPRGMRTLPGGDDLGTYASSVSGQSMRADSMYLQQPYGAHSVAKPAQSDAAGSGQYVPKYRKRSRAPAPGVCHACGNSDTPEWRRGPDGARTLCNACGLHFSKLVRRRTLEYANAAPGTPIPPVTTAELRASTNVGNHANMNMAPGTGNASVPVRTRPTSMYSNPAAAPAPARPVPVDPAVEVSGGASSVPPPAPQPAHAELDRSHDVTRSEEAGASLGKRPAGDAAELEPAGQQPRAES